LREKWQTERGQVWEVGRHRLMCGDADPRFWNARLRDPFLGSGTMVAAEQLGRICYGMEIEPKYVAVTLERMSGMGLEPKLDTGK
jgi:hypothetical protein